MPSNPFTLGMAQILVEGGQPEANLARAVAAIHAAAERGCRVVVLPECLDFGWTHGAARTGAQPIPGPHADQLAAAARMAAIYVAAGLVERAGDRLYNAAVFYSPTGKLLRRHRKINELDIAHDLYSCGDSLAVTATPDLGTVGLTICADNAPNSLALGHALCRMGARLILSPSAWAVPPQYDNAREPYGTMWRDAYTQLARLYDATTVGVSNVGLITDGPWKNWNCIGNSLAVGPAGQLAQGPHGPDAAALLTITVTPPPPPPWGTALRSQLGKRGYDGP